MLIKWSVTPYSREPERREYDSETNCYYTYRSGRSKAARRDAKSSLYYRYFDSEAEALEYIRLREESKIDQARVDQIKRCGVELLEVLEEVMKYYPFPDSVIASNAKYVIAKAKGITQ